MNESEERKVNTEEEKVEEIKDTAGETVPQSISFEELNKKIEEYEAELKDLKDKYLRALADQDNLRKRVEKEKSELFNYGLTNFIKELLPVVDTLENALIEAQKSSDNSQALVEGIKLILSKFHSVLKKHGVKEIEALNKPFDPSLHEAIAKTERNDVEPMIIVAVSEKGYLLKGRILRPSKVVVAVEPSAQQNKTESEIKEDEKGEVDNG
jgi:molecular chaperone GrpE